MAIPELKLSYTLRIGVAGHRKLSDPEAISRAVERVVADLDQELSHQDRTPVEWRVLSPAAKGADRVAARAILKTKPSARLELVFPFPVDRYREDFVEAEDRADFEGLLALSVDQIELNRGSDFPRNQDERNLGYQEAGEALADASEILILIWDGQEARGTGGTGDLARYAVKGRSSVVWINANSPEDVQLLVCSDSNKDQLKGIPWRNRTPLSSGYAALDAFLHSNPFTESVYLSEWGREAAELTDDAASARIPLQWVSWIQETFLPFQVRAGLIATHYQRKYQWASFLIFGLAALAVTAGAANQLFLHSRLITVAEILMMLAILRTWRASRKGEWHKKWLSMRYLSEQLRIAKFAANPQKHLSHARRSLRFYPGPEGWLPDAVQRVVSRAERYLPANLKTSGPDPQLLQNFIISAWLVRQTDWHQNNARRKEKAAHRSRQLVIGAFVGTLLACFLHLLPFFGNISSFLAITLPVWAASAHGISRQLEFERLAQRSTQMAEVLGQITERARRTHSEEGFAELLREAASLSTTENHEWWVLLGFDPPELIV